MVTTRRNFLQRGACAVLGAVNLGNIPYPMDWTAPSVPLGTLLGERDVQLDTARALAHRAVDAARRAGATYADVRLTRRHIHGSIGAPLSLRSAIGDSPPIGPAETQEIAIGVRALYRGYWGFASSPYWTEDEAVRLAKESVAQAKVNSSGIANEIDMGSIPRVDNGSWSTPMKIDPFTVSFDEQVDYFRSLLDDIDQLGALHAVGWATGSAQWGFAKTEKISANSEGSSYTQEFCTGYLRIDVSTETDVGARALGNYTFSLPIAHRGWEDFTDPAIRKSIPEWIDTAEREKRHTGEVKPVEPSRYEAVFDASSVAKLLSNTIGQSSELDRALGYEANAGGTGYFDAPLEQLGTFKAGSELLTVTASRSEPKDLATTKWDEEGVEPDEFTIVQNGILNDFQTTRESATWLAPWYTQQGRPVRSHGCSRVNSAYDLPMQHVPNLSIRPGRESVGFEDLVTGVKRGVVVSDSPYARARVDQQGKFGYGAGFVVREIVNGKVGAVMKDGGFLFDAITLWKNLKAIGGPQSVQAVPIGTDKGEPRQTSQYTLRAVPAAFSELAVIDTLRNY